MPPNRTPAWDPSHHNSPTSLMASDFGRHPLTSIPSKPELTRHLISLHAKLQTASAPNALSLRLPVPSGLKIAEWRSRLSGYHDSSLCDYLEFGWPIGYTSLATPASTHTNSSLESSPDKDCAPSQTMIFLGILFNSVDMTMSVTNDCLNELLSRCQSLLDLCVVSRWDLQSLLGVMSFVTACVRPARIFMSSLLNTLRAHSSSRFCSLTPENKSDLRWRCHFVPSYYGVSLIKTSQWIHDTLTFSTDACGSGAGGYFNGKYFHTPFPPPIMPLYGHDINILELLRIMVALKLWGAALSGQRVIISCDNENSVFALNSGRSRSPGMQLCLREIWFLSAAFDFEIRTDHVPGVSNAIADHLSRWHLSPSHKAHFEALTSGIPTTFVSCPP